MQNYRMGSSNYDSSYDTMTVIMTPTEKGVIAGKPNYQGL